PASGGGAVAAGAREGARAADRCATRTSALGASMGETREIALTVNGQRYEEGGEVRGALPDFVGPPLRLTRAHLGRAHRVSPAPAARPAHAAPAPSPSTVSGRDPA